MKVLNDLLGYEKLKIYQDTDYFSFSLDSVLLPNFVTIGKSVNRILDIGTGNAPIPLILTRKTNADIIAFEIQKEIFDLAKETLEINSLTDRIKLIHDDINNIEKYCEKQSFDIIISNPPYFKNETLSKKNKNSIKSIARHEIKLNLEQLVSISNRYLKNNGILSIVYRTERLCEVLNTMHLNNIEPKKILFIFPKRGRPSNLFIVEGVKNGRQGLKEVSNIIVHNDDGSYSDEVLKYFS